MENRKFNINLHNNLTFIAILFGIVFILVFLRNYSYYYSKKITDSIEITNLAKNIHILSKESFARGEQEREYIQTLNEYLNETKPYGIVKLSKDNQVLVNYNRTKNRHHTRALVKIPQYLTTIPKLPYLLDIAKHSTPNILSTVFNSMTFSLYDFYQKTKETNLKEATNWYQQQRLFLRSRDALIFMLLGFIGLVLIRRLQTPIIKANKSHNPQKLITILSNFTLDKPLKYSTHYWDFELKKEYGGFDGFMQAVAINFESIDRELKELSPNLHQKIYTFLFEKKPREDYSWCSRADINIGWSSLQGLKEHCNSGKKPSEFKLPTIIEMENEDITNFKQVIELFKQEIEIRSEFNNLEEIFEAQYDNIGEQFEYDPYQSKLKKQFYTDRESLLNAINSIFVEMGKRAEYPQIEVSTQEREDRSIEITITQINSTLDKDPQELLHKIKNGGGDLGNIKKLLSNLCDWSIEGRFEERDFRVNILKSNNIKDIEISKSSPKGFSHILRFYR
ncbi:MAG: hypothetical protein KU38_04985 [Sulfurovum sp. FS08-3]|nr:MAG: hypothetical protein KU38_04985 [Sulfurovum sp. FS08-3]